MRVVSPKGSEVGYFRSPSGILHVAPMVGRKLDMSQTLVVDFFDDNIDWEEAMVALNMLEEYDDESTE